MINEVPVKYKLRVKVNQIVTREINLLVDANSEEDAERKAREALEEYPKPVKVGGVSSILVTKTNYWIPKDLEFVYNRSEDG